MKGDKMSKYNVFTSTIGDCTVVEIKPRKLTKEETKKLRAIRRTIMGEYNGPRAARYLKISTRQVRNLKSAVYAYGDYGVIHKNRFHRPPIAYSEEVRKEIVDLYRKKENRGMLISHFAEMLIDEFGYDMAPSTIYNILRENRIRSPKMHKKKRKTNNEKN